MGEPAKSARIKRSGFFHRTGAGSDEVCIGTWLISRESRGDFD